MNRPAIPAVLHRGHGNCVELRLFKHFANVDILGRFVAERVLNPRGRRRQPLA